MSELCTSRNLGVGLVGLSSILKLGQLGFPYIPGPGTHFVRASQACRNRVNISMFENPMM